MAGLGLTGIGVYIMLRFVKHYEVLTLFLTVAIIFLFLMLYQESGQWKKAVGHTQMKRRIDEFIATLDHLRQFESNPLIPFSFRNSDLNSIK